MTIAIEPLSLELGHFLNTAAEADQLIERIDSPHCQLHLDCIAMSTEQIAIPDLIRNHRQRLVHFHANDPNKQGPGFGSLDFGPILAAIQTIDYRGWLSVEVFDYAPGVERLAKESIAYLRRVHEQISNGD